MMLPYKYTQDPVVPVRLLSQEHQAYLQPLRVQEVLGDLVRHLHRQHRQHHQDRQDPWDLVVRQAQQAQQDQEDPLGQEDLLHQA
jgi:hypothetical protein